MHSVSLSDFLEDLLTGASGGAHVVIDPTLDLISLLSTCNFSTLRVILAFGVPQVKVMRGLFNVQDVNVRVADYRHCEAVIMLSRLGAGPHKAVGAGTVRHLPLLAHGRGAGDSQKGQKLLSKADGKVAAVRLSHSPLRLPSDVHAPSIF